MQAAETSRLSIAFGLLLAILPWAYNMALQTHVLEMKRSIDKNMNEQKKLVRERRWAEEKLMSAKAESNKMESFNRGMLHELLLRGDNIDMDTMEYERAEAQEEVYLGRLDDCRSSIVALGRRHLQQYDNAKVQVRVSLDRDIASGVGNSFVIQMAPFHIAPHASSHFVRMVEAKLFDGLALMRQKAPGSTMIHSAALDTKTGKFAENRFMEEKLTTLQFDEHSEDYPNEKYIGKLTALIHSSRSRTSM